MRLASMALLLGLGLALPTAVHAQPTARPRERALRLFDESREHYRAGRFKEAARRLREAYRLQPEPILLYNLGRALDGAGELEEAIEAYEKYLRDERAVPDRGAIEQRVATMRRLLDENRALERRTTAGPAPPPPTEVVAVVPVAPSRTRPPGVAPWALTGLGVATLATGAAFGGLAINRHHAAQGDPVQASAASAQSTAKRYATTATVLFAVGGVATAAGLAWLITRWVWPERRSPRAARVPAVRLVLGPGAAALVGGF